METIPDGRKTEAIMSGVYLGHLPESDPLFQYLKDEIRPQTGGNPGRLKYRVFRLNGSNDVYLYEEKHTGVRVIGKFFLSAREHDPAAASRRLNREFENLTMMRGLGFQSYPHYIARPLGRNESLNRLLVTEFCGGEQLSSVILRAIHESNSALLYDKLRALAYFLAAFHNRTAAGNTVDFNPCADYLLNLARRLLRQTLLSGSEMSEFYFLRDRWREQPKMWEDQQVLVHGDATPDNFLFGGDLGVISFDLERLHKTDRIYDTGRVAAELLHFFLLNTGNKYAAEPFIGHFLWEYACHFPDRERTFAETTRRVPFYMGITLLRNARNNWLSWEYRKRLIHEARLCLRKWTL